MNNVHLKNKVVVITGGASGIGLAVGKCFARYGASIALLDISDRALAICSENWPVEAKAKLLTIVCDVASLEDCTSAVDKVYNNFGHIDVIVANAGIGQRGPFHTTAIEVYRKVMDVNFFGALNCTKAALKYLMDSKGAIIAIESIAALTPLLGRTGYSASKHAMHGFFTSLRGELRPLGIHVMIVCPGFVETDFEKHTLGPDGLVATRPRSKVGKLQSPDTVAKAILKSYLSRRNILVLSPVGKISWWISRLSPRLYERLMCASLRSELSWD